MNRKLLLLLALLISITLQAKDYYVKVGQSITLRCTATPPAGTITHATFEIANSSDAQYLALTAYNTSAKEATFVGLQAKSSIKINVTYYYSYKGSYSNNMQVGHGTYTDYVTVQTGVAATDINISPKGINMRIGETATAKVVLTPANAVTKYEVGYIESLSSAPSTFDWSFADGVFTITAKKAGSLYLVARISDKLIGVCTVRATADGSTGQEPKSIELSAADATVEEGKKLKINYRMLPVGSSSTIQWASDNISVASVNKYGEVTAQKEGKVNITATTANGVSNSISLTVVPQVKGIALPKQCETYVGFNYQLEPTLTPVNAIANLTWQSSDAKIATVSSDGKVYGRKPGTVTIKASNGASINASTEVTVLKPTLIDHLNAAARTKELDIITNRIFLNIK